MAVVVPAGALSVAGEKPHAVVRYAPDNTGLHPDHIGSPVQAAIAAASGMIYC